MSGIQKMSGHPAVVALSLMIVALSVLLCVVLLAPGRDRQGKEQQKRTPMPQAAEKKAPQPKLPAYTFPKGGTELFPQYRLVALYGTPSSTRMGALGEQPLAESVARARALSDQYQQYSTETIWPAFEIIATIASATPTADGNYSRELDVAELRPWIDGAKEAGMYVILDLQPGRTDFLTQAKLYESLLLEPHVGLALDPEWRLLPNQVHLKQIGSVGAAEINSVAAWLADLTRRHNLPQKAFLLHQFRLSMITDRVQLDTSHKELAYIIQMDGNGAQSTKLTTWRTILADPPARMQFGWKNFYDEDHPVLSPEATMQLDPKPWYVSYQ